MKTQYDKYYQTENLFGEAYPELLDYFGKLEHKGKVLDLGCGQGRDSIALSRLGFSVTGIDHSGLGIKQLQKSTSEQGLAIEAIVADIYSFSEFDSYDYILLDSMFHFDKKNRDSELILLKKIWSGMHRDSYLLICIQDTGKKVDYVIQALAENQPIHNQAFHYTFIDQQSGHGSKTPYRLIVFKKDE